MSDVSTYDFSMSLSLRNDKGNKGKHKASLLCVYGCVFWGSPSVYKYKGNEGMQKASLRCACERVYLGLLRQLKSIGRRDTDASWRLDMTSFDFLPFLSHPSTDCSSQGPPAEDAQLI